MPMSDACMRACISEGQQCSSPALLSSHSASYMGHEIEELGADL